MVSKGEKMRLAAIVYRATDTRDEKRIYVACITAPNSWLLFEIARGGKDETTSESEAPLLIDTRV